MSQLLRLIARTAVQRRGICCSTALSKQIAVEGLGGKDVAVEGASAYEHKIGKREIVGYGFNGLPNYMDRADFPFPAIRFREETPEIQKLREKEKGDWKKLTLEEKKALYRASFCQTFAELNAPTGEWRTILAGTLLGLTLTVWLMIYMKQFVYPPLPHTINREYQVQELQRMIAQGQGPIEGISSKYDFEKGDWKK
ncbi:hypothetical protein ACJMK2_009717 [Sinanodonta woodiana]|uniref:Cytochrome c oxidase subunit 4 n=1 Tax=Sinanodonta woodiana TaxID=1069815 RepID=A0ABD3VD32_SINWO